MDPRGTCPAPHRSHHRAGRACGRPRASPAALDLIDPDPEHLPGKAEQALGDGVDGQVRPHRLAVGADAQRESRRCPANWSHGWKASPSNWHSSVAWQALDERIGRRREGPAMPSRIASAAATERDRASRRAQGRPRLEPGEPRDLPPRRRTARASVRGSSRARGLLERAPEPLAQVAIADMGEEGVARLVVDGHAHGAGAPGLEPGDHVGGQPVERSARGTSRYGRSSVNAADTATPARTPARSAARARDDRHHPDARH